MELGKLTWPTVATLDRDIPVMIPVAALEQHGHHLPLLTDSLLLTEIVNRVEREFSKQLLVAPLMWLGNSHHHLDFPGTLSGEPRVWLDLLSGLIDNFIHHGFRRIFILNGHGGNDVPGKQAIFELRQRYRTRAELLLLFATYWSFAPEVATSLQLEQPEMGHAGEWETSMMLRIHPELVDSHQQVDEVPAGNPFLPAQRAWIMPDRSLAGHVGKPSVANAKKGEQLFATFSASVSSFVHRIIDWNGSSWDG